MLHHYQEKGKRTLGGLSLSLSLGRCQGWDRRSGIHPAAKRHADREPPSAPRSFVPSLSHSTTSPPPKTRLTFFPIVFELSHATPVMGTIGYPWCPSHRDEPGQGHQPREHACSCPVLSHPLQVLIVALPTHTGTLGSTSSRFCVGKSNYSDYPPRGQHQLQPLPFLSFSSHTRFLYEALMLPLSVRENTQLLLPNHHRL